MWLELVLLVTGALVGWLTNLWFERRARRDSERENRQLREELTQVRSELSRVRGTLLSLGGSDAEPAAAARSADLVTEIAKRARRTQDARGRVQVQHLRSHFAATGLRKRDFEDALEELVDSGVAARDGTWLKIL